LLGLRRDSSLPSLFVMLALLAATPALQLNGRAAPAVAPAAAPQTRRQLIQTAAAAAAAAAAGGVAPALAGGDTFNRMSGVLEPFTDVQKGFKLYKPVAWNQFEADPGVYDMKWVDLIEPFETVQVSTSPVSTATSISALGELDEVGAKFAKSRDAQLVSSKSRDADGSLAYTFELKGDAYHECSLRPSPSQRAVAPPPAHAPPRPHAQVPAADHQPRQALPPLHGGLEQALVQAGRNVQKRRPLIRAQGLLSGASEPGLSRDGFRAARSAAHSVTGEGEGRAAFWFAMLWPLSAREEASGSPGCDEGGL